MGEIKSTLDLIMERTKDMTVSQEEREAFRRQEKEANVQGWVQKYVDGVFTRTRVLELLGKAQEGDPGIRPLFRQAVLARIDPEQDNERMLGLLVEMGDVPMEPIRQALQVFRDAMVGEESARRDILRQALAKRGIRGTAIVPNLASDNAWASMRERERARFRERLVVHK